MENALSESAKMTGAGKGEAFSFYRLWVDLQSPAFFGESSVLRLQVDDLLRLCFRPAPLSLALAQRLCKALAQSRSLERQPRPAEADELRGGHTHGETRDARHHALATDAHAV